MNTVRVIKTHLEENLQFGYYDDKNETFVSVTTPDEIEKASKDLKVPKELIEALTFYHEQLLENLAKDLRDIWGRLDNIESRS